MALVRIQATPKVTSGSSVTSIAVTFGTLPIVGNGIIVCVGAAVGSGATTSVVDNRGNTYILAKSQSEANLPSTVDIYYCSAIATTGTPFTVTVNGGDSFRVAIAIEVSGGPLAIDAAISAAGGFPTAASPGTTPALTGTEVFVVAGIRTSSSTIAVDATTPTWLEEAEQLASSVNTEFDSRRVTSAVATTQTVTYTLGGANYWNTVLVAFKPLAAPTSAGGGTLASAVQLFAPSVVVLTGARGAIWMGEGGGTIWVE